MAGTLVILKSVRDYNGFDMIGTVIPLFVDARVLAANTNEDHTVPTGASYVMFSANIDFYAKAGGTAAVPAGDVTDGTASFLNPTLWDVTGQTTIGLITAAAGGGIVTMAWFK